MSLGAHGGRVPYKARQLLVLGHLSHRLQPSPAPDNAAPSCSSSNMATSNPAAPTHRPHGARLTLLSLPSPPHVVQAGQSVP
ncbi:hypothetical protein Pcinc_006940 [Petrolisthes cinctipes]|uniref:Uncharacterized protein n=1 Tax=Petrolisthes cinctipes TaxID=88211 RepID=A0AAE1GAE9_PETCI|nr:hypothetical protein Pcinc_006940 [Petrolisthes cinctipes]